MRLVRPRGKTGRVRLANPLAAKLPVGIGTHARLFGFFFRPSGGRQSLLSANADVCICVCVPVCGRARGVFLLRPRKPLPAVRSRSVVVYSGRCGGVRQKGNFHVFFVVPLSPSFCRENGYSSVRRCCRGAKYNCSSLRPFSREVGEAPVAGKGRPGRRAGAAIGRSGATPQHARSPQGGEEPAVETHQGTTGVGNRACSEKANLLEKSILGGVIFLARRAFVRVFSLSSVSR